MIRRFAMIFVFSAALLLGGTAFAQDDKTAPESKAPEKVVTVCPVAGEEVTDTKTATFSDYKDVRYYFCCPGCKVSFDKNPEKYAKKAEKKK